MGKHYDQLNQGKRDRIKILLDEGHTYRAIGRALNIHHTTVSREIINKSYGSDNRTAEERRNTYDSTYAHTKTTNLRRTASWQGKKIERNIMLRYYVITRLKEKWNPDEIAGHMKKHKACATTACLSPDVGAGCSGGTIYASKNTIYEWLRSVWGQQYCELLYSKRYRKKSRSPKKIQRGMIPNRTSIHDRPEPVNNRSEPGHWEKDACSQQ